mmetsp:Transcript_23102/g.45449  ORF Transcript_23102/g.45449 Transcript_23102/m.45449 type:complete len:102 (+) Transcript_23102:987-1292(+)
MFPPTTHAQSCTVSFLCQQKDKNSQSSQKKRSEEETREGRREMRRECEGKTGEKRGYSPGREGHLSLSWCVCLPFFSPFSPVLLGMEVLFLSSPPLTTHIT